MTLPFSTTWPDRMGDLAGQPNYFIQKIWAGIPADDGDYFQGLKTWRIYFKAHQYKFGRGWDFKPWDKDNVAKPHTIREDPRNRWRPGMKIHPVINNRSKYRFQFAPSIECTGVQLIRICHRFVPHPPAVYVGGYLMDRMSDEQIEQLALNDGFPSVEAFFRWFNTDFSGKLIHWTDLRY